MGKAVASGVQPTKCCVQPAGCAKADARPVPELWRRRGDPEQGRGAELSGYFSGYLHLFRLSYSGSKFIGRKGVMDSPGRP